MRVPLGFVFGAACLWLARPTASNVIAGAIVAIVGEAIRVWAAGHLEKGREVTSSGPYRWSGHPLYIGSSVMGVGLAIGASRLEVTLIVAVYLVVTLLAAIRTEEAHLASAFGDEYARYRAGRAAGSARPFSWARVRANREYRAALGLAGAIAALAFKAVWR
jgi:protein-S-isoprenylcysteine O-methyltransferase Ste14